MKNDRNPILKVFKIDFYYIYAVKTSFRALLKKSKKIDFEKIFFDHASTKFAKNQVFC